MAYEKFRFYGSLRLIKLQNSLRHLVLKRFGDQPTRAAIRTIGVLMYGLLGDTLIRTPLLRELRVLYPAAHIIAFVDTPGREALSLTNLPNEIVVVDRQKRFMRIDLFQRIVHFLTLRLSSIDLLIDLYMGGSSQTIAKISGARFKIFAGFEETTCSWNSRRIRLGHFGTRNIHHYSNSSLNCLAFLTQDRPNLSTRPELDLARLEAVSRSQQGNRASQFGPFFVVSVGAGDPRKVPEIGKVGALCKYVHDREGFSTVIIQNPGQETLQESLLQVLAHLDVPAYPLEPMRLEQIASLMLQAKFVITPDSGLFHLAVGLGVNLLSLFTYTNPELVRPDTDNCTIIFDPESPEVSIPNKLPFGRGTPSVEHLLAATELFLNNLHNRNVKDTTAK